jgi:hypothetical protein
MSMTNGRDMTRAERFEDEKKRIVESCFSKRDDDGSRKPAYRETLIAIATSPLLTASVALWSQCKKHT